MYAFGHPTHIGCWELHTQLSACLSAPRHGLFCLAEQTRQTWLENRTLTKCPYNFRPPSCQISIWNPSQRSKMLLRGLRIAVVPEMVSFCCAFDVFGIQSTGFDRFWFFRVPSPGVPFREMWLIPQQLFSHVHRLPRA